jgi:hypothetical protein
MEDKAAVALRIASLMTVMAIVPLLLNAEPSAAVEDVQHMMGMEKWHMQVMARDAEHRVTRELGSDDGDTVERNTSYYVGGKALASQETTVHSRLQGHRLTYAEKDKWSKSGKLEYSYRETNALNSSGDQDKGERSEKSLEFGRLNKEVDGNWSPQAKGWVDSYIRTFSYYKDGDPKACITERPPTNEKVEEHWGVKGSHGRDKTTRTWDASTKSWIRS